MTDPARPLRPLRLAFMLVAILAFVGAVPAVAVAQGNKVHCDVIEIHASTGTEAKIPDELKPLAKKLKKPPFSAWNVFKVLSRASKDLDSLKPMQLKLSLGQASLLVRGITQGAKKARIQLSITVDDQNGKRVLDTKVNADAGDYLVVGRSLGESEGHLLALTCKP